MDIALTLKEDDYLYSGSVIGNTKSEYNAILWLDARVKPTFAELKIKWDSISVKIKKKMLKDIRDEILVDNLWIMNRIVKDQIKIRMGIITEAHKKWSDAEQLLYVNWYEIMIALPRTVNFDSFDLNDIKKNNTGIFPVCPIDKSDSNDK
jgi:hypothetical protein